MRGEFFIGDRLCYKAGMSTNINVFFVGAKEKADSLWEVSLGFGGSYGQAGFGFSPTIEVRTGEPLRFSAFKTAFREIGPEKTGKTVKTSFSVMIFRDIQKDRIVVDFKDAEEAGAVNPY